MGFYLAMIYSTPGNFSITSVIFYYYCAISALRFVQQQLELVTHRYYISLTRAYEVVLEGVECPFFCLASETARCD